MKVHHVGYLVKDAVKSKDEFMKLGYSVKQDVVYDETRDCNIAFLELDGFLIELVQPVSEKSPVYQLLNKYRDVPYHVCYETDDLECEVTHLLKNDYFIVREAEVSMPLNNRQVVFLCKKGVGMIELME